MHHPREWLRRNDWQAAGLAGDRFGVRDSGACARSRDVGRWLRPSLASAGNLAGFLGPYLIGVAKDATGSATSDLSVIALFLLLGAVLVVIATRASGRE